jgi:hypothetical protein
MVKWHKIVKEWKYEYPKRFWKHWFHDTYKELYPFENEKKIKVLCRTCKVWWYRR